MAIFRYNDRKKRTALSPSVTQRLTWNPQKTRRGTPFRRNIAACLKTFYVSDMASYKSSGSPVDITRKIPSFSDVFCAGRDVSFISRHITPRILRRKKSTFSVP